MDDHLKSFSLLGRVGRGLGVDLRLLENAGDLVSNHARLEEAVVRQRRVVGGWRGEMPSFIGSVEAITVSVKEVSKAMRCRATA